MRNRLGVILRQRGALIRRDRQRQVRQSRDARAGPAPGALLRLALNLLVSLPVGAAPTIRRASRRDPLLPQLPPAASAQRHHDAFQVTGPRGALLQGAQYAEISGTPATARPDSTRLTVSLSNQCPQLEQRHSSRTTSKQSPPTITRRARSRAPRMRIARCLPRTGVNAQSGMATYSDRRV
jgi:hypothetical protein